MEDQWLPRQIQNILLISKTMGDFNIRGVWLWRTSSTIELGLVSTRLNWEQENLPRIVLSLGRRRQTTSGWSPRMIFSQRLLNTFLKEAKILWCTVTSNWRHWQRQLFATILMMMRGRDVERLSSLSSILFTSPKYIRNSSSLTLYCFFVTSRMQKPSLSQFSTGRCRYIANRHIKVSMTSSSSRQLRISAWITETQSSALAWSHLQSSSSSCLERQKCRVYMQSTVSLKGLIEERESLSSSKIFLTGSPSYSSFLLAQFLFLTSKISNWLVFSIPMRSLISCLRSLICESLTEIITFTFCMLGRKTHTSSASAESLGIIAVAPSWLQPKSSQTSFSSEQGQLLKTFSRNSWMVCFLFSMVLDLRVEMIDSLERRRRQNFMPLATMRSCTLSRSLKRGQMVETLPLSSMLAMQTVQELKKLSLVSVPRMVMRMQSWQASSLCCFNFWLSTLISSFLSFSSLSWRQVQLSPTNCTMFLQYLLLGSSLPKKNLNQIGSSVILKGIRTALLSRSTSDLQPNSSSSIMSSKLISLVSQYMRGCFPRAPKKEGKVFFSSRNRSRIKNSSTWSLVSWTSFQITRLVFRMSLQSMWSSSMFLRYYSMMTLYLQILWTGLIMQLSRLRLREVSPSFLR